MVSSDDVLTHGFDAASARAAGQLCAASARAAGQLCAATATFDVIDASVVLVARLVDGVTVTSDPDDLRRLDPSIDLATC